MAGFGCPLVAGFEVPADSFAGEIELAAAAGALVDLPAGMHRHDQQGAVDAVVRKRLDIADHLGPLEFAGIGDSMWIGHEMIEACAAPLAESRCIKLADQFVNLTTSPKRIISILKA